MSYCVVLTDEARNNAREIRDWLSERSPAGAKRWVIALKDALFRLEETPSLSNLAPENDYADVELRNVFFKTPRGRVYRAIFYVTQDTVTVTHIRGPRQQLLSRHDVKDV